MIIFINAAHGLTHYSLLILPTAVLTMVTAGGGFGTDYGPILQLATGGFVLYGLFSLPQGWLAARIGRHALMAVFFLGTGACLALAGFARTPLALGAALAGAGLFAAIYHPVGTAMLVDVAGDRPGQALGLNGVFGNIGVATAPVVTAVARQPVRLALGLRGARPRLRRPGAGLAAHAIHRPPPPHARQGPSPPSRAIWCAAPWWCCC